MSQELKIRISNYKDIEKKLNKLDAEFAGEENFTDTYFNRPKGVVFKISANDRGSNLLHLKSVEGKFEIISSEKIENVDKAKNELISKYGIKTVLKGKRKYFQLNDLKITINLIDDLGEFLILTGENPTEDFIIKTLKIKNPQYVKVSFDELRNN